MGPRTFEGADMELPRAVLRRPRYPWLRFRLCSMDAIRAFASWLCSRGYLAVCGALVVAVVAPVWSTIGALTARDLDAVQANVGHVFTAHEASGQADEPVPLHTRLGHVLANHRLELAACFEENGLGRAHVRIHLDVSRAGLVESARIEPRELRDHAVGLCLHSVAKGIEFSPSDQPAAFVVPLIARRR